MTPAGVEAEVDSKRPREDVFDFCSDPSLEPEWEFHDEARSEAHRWACRGQSSLHD